MSEDRLFEEHVSPQAFHVSVHDLCIYYEYYNHEPTKAFE